MESLSQLIAEHVLPKTLWPTCGAAAPAVLALLSDSFVLGPTPQMPDTIVLAIGSSTGDQNQLGHNMGIGCHAGR